MNKILRALALLLLLSGNNSLVATHGWLAEVRYESMENQTGNPLDYMIYWEYISPFNNQPVGLSFDIYSSCFPTTSHVALPYYEPYDSILPNGRIFLEDFILCTSMIDIPDSLNLVRFKTPVTLPGICQDYEFSMIGFCCMIPADNLLNSGVFRPSTILDNRRGVNSNSLFDHHAAYSACQDIDFNFSHSLTDSDGDSIHLYYTDYASGWANGYSYSHPLPSSSPVVWNSANGNMIINPDTSGRFMLAFVIEEYRWDSISSGYYQIGKRYRYSLLYITDTCRMKPENIEPEISGQLPCNSDSVKVFFNSPIRCNSISNGELRLFRLSDSTMLPIIGYDTTKCVKGYTSSILLKLHQAITYNDSFILVTFPGWDGNTFLNSCGQWIPVNQIMGFATTSCVGGLSLSDQGGKSQIQLYPTITRGELNLVFHNRFGNQSSEFMILNNQGQVLRSWRSSAGKDHEETINVAALPPGIYTLVIQSGEQMVSKAFIRK